MKELTEQEIKKRFVEFLEADIESYDAEITRNPIKLSAIDDFEDLSSCKWASQEILNRIYQREDTMNDILVDFCSEMITYQYKAKNQRTMERFASAYRTGYYLMDLFDLIAYGGYEE